MTATDKIPVENVNVPGYTRNVDAGKYLAMREVLLEVLPAKPPGITQAAMASAVRPRLPQDLWPNGDKAMWWIKTVQLDLEAKGLVSRNTATKPLRWYRS